ncbi:MAG: LPS export ABC transporter permease LptG, partial [Rickettsiales bacterium]
LLGLLVIAGLLDTVELIRRGASREAASIGVILEMAFFKWPSMAEKLIPFAGLIGGMVALAKLTKSHELIVARAAGVSVWQFMLPPFLAMLMLGSLFIMAYNPVASTMLSRFEKLEGKYLAGRSSLLTVSPSGLWLRQVESESQKEKEHIIHALRVSDQGMKLSHVTVFTFGQGLKFIKRIDADSAVLEKGYWLLNDALISYPGEPAERKDYEVLNTDLTVAQIQDSFASPRTLSFWALPGFIKALEAAGFSALNHKLHWHVVLSTPIMLCAMALVAAAFSLRLPRKGGTRLLIVVGVFTGFFLFFISNIIFSLGLSGALPVELAAWIPTGIIMLAGAAVLLHLEDG